ncbi:hypothetical protein, partial [Bacteroides graminisolvens]|uniref:hypothetical protein n=1 Tax=Bacteroides graminisolvens TaxID=477666 RepID=UPI000468F29B
MKKQELNVKVKEIIIETLNLNMEVKDILDETPLFGTSYKPGLFDNSLCVLEVTSALVGEFDIELHASIIKVLKQLVLWLIAFIMLLKIKIKSKYV